MTHWATRFAADLADHCLQGILLVDNDFGILQANPRAAALFGAKAESDLPGKTLHWSESTAGIGLDRPLILEAGGIPQDGKYIASTEFGAELPVQLDFLPAGGSGDRQAAAYVVLVTDLTAQVDLERTVLQAEKLEAMDNIVAGIAHELNNPMTAILGYSELLLATEKDPKRKQRIALIAEEADRCGKIIANMLTFTRSYGKTLEMASLNALLEEVLSLQSYQLRVDNVKIHSFYEPSLPMIMLQPAAMRRLFLNLLHNAHQALLESPSGRRNLWALTERRDDNIFVQIADDGPGIPKTIRHKIFDPFFTTRPFGEGMGLGLSVAFGIVHDHKGRIWMEPRVGGGTAMNIEFPLPAAKP